MIDTARIVVRGGNGGVGAISFRREKYVPRGGPDGGDGGDGGSIVLQAQSGNHLLRNFRFNRRFLAEDGQSGHGRNKTGRSGADNIIGVPVGTLVTGHGGDGGGELIADLNELGASALVARGGYGGKGNARFSHSQNRVPLLAEEGQVTEDITLELELQLLADVAIMGMPSVGKSSLLRACTRARRTLPRTRSRHWSLYLDTSRGEHGDFVLVEIPGLLEGAHRGVGLGSDFLRHAQRVTTIVHLLDRHNRRSAC